MTIETSSSIPVVSTKDFLSLILVGSLWGITNPFMRKGSSNTNVDTETSTSTSTSTSTTTRKTSCNSRLSSLLNYFYNFIQKILNVSIWLPYLINQAGSLLFYKLLATSELSIVVPICNAVALIVSALVGYYGRPFGVGEQMDQPRKAFLGITLVILGVALCMHDRHARENVNIIIGNFESQDDVPGDEL